RDYNGIPGTDQGIQACFDLLLAPPLLPNNVSAAGSGLIAETAGGGDGLQDGHIFIVIRKTPGTLDFPGDIVDQVWYKNRIAILDFQVLLGVSGQGRGQGNRDFLLRAALVRQSRLINL